MDEEPAATDEREWLESQAGLSFADMDRYLDVETLRLVYQSINVQLEASQQTNRSLLTEFTALAPTAGAVLALFFGAKPDKVPTYVNWLYVGGVLLFIGIFVLSIRSLISLEAARIQLKVAEESQFRANLEPTDFYSERQWLVDRIIKWRAITTTLPKYYAPYRFDLWRIRVLFGAMVIYLAAVTMIALLV